MDAVANRPAGSTVAGSDRDLAVLALDLSAWTDERALALNADPGAALARLAEIARPMKLMEPGGMVVGEDGKRVRGPKTDALMGALRTIGAKVSPTMSEEQVNVWLVAITTALTDLPFVFAIRGVREAVHVPIQFLNQVETVVREKAEYAATKHRVAVNRLEHLKRKLARANEPALPKPEARELTQDEIDAMPAHLRSLGLKLGHITQEQFDAARKDEE